MKRVLYTIYQHLKRYNHFNTTTHDKKCNAILLTSSPTMHLITLPQDKRTTTNNIFIPERPQPIKCRTIYHRWNYTTIQNHFNITGHYITRQRYRTLLNAIYFNSTHFNENQPHRRNNTFQYGRTEHRSKTTSNYFNMDNLQTGRAIIFHISHYKETSRTTYHKQDKTRTRGK